MTHEPTATAATRRSDGGNGRRTTDDGRSSTDRPARQAAPARQRSGPAAASACPTETQRAVRRHGASARRRSSAPRRPRLVAVLRADGRRAWCSSCSARACSARRPTSSSSGVEPATGIDFGALHRKLLLVAAIYLGVVGARRTRRRTSSPASSSARCIALRESVEHKLNRLPLSYIDRQPRGDLLSRVTNDIDNLAQSLQQTIEPDPHVAPHADRRGDHDVHDLAAAGGDRARSPCRCRSWLMKFIGGKARPRFIVAVAPHRQPQRPGRGGVHRPRDREELRPPARGRGPLPRRQRRAVRGQLRRPVHVQPDPADDDLHRQHPVRPDRRRRWPADLERRDHASATCRR